MLAYWERLKSLQEYAPHVKRAAIPFAIAAATGGASLAVYWQLSEAEISAESTATVVVAAVEDGTASTPVVSAASPPEQKAPFRDDRSAITRALQTELKRVGCYEGQVNGIWTSSSRAAMRSFTERVNAMLPVEQPDQILLALVQAHRDKVCGATCPAGQVPGGWGRCQPDPSLPSSMQTASTTAPPISALTPPLPAAADHSKAVTVATVEQELDGPRAPAESAVAGPETEEVQSPSPPVTRERRARRNNARKQSFNPPPVARAVMNGLKNLQRALGGFP